MPEILSQHRNSCGNSAAAYPDAATQAALSSSSGCSLSSIPPEKLRKPEPTGSNRLVGDFINQGAEQFPTRSNHSDYEYQQHGVIHISQWRSP
jgi:hypothetical protein